MPQIRNEACLNQFEMTNLHQQSMNVLFSIFTSFYRIVCLIQNQQKLNPGMQIDLNNIDFAIAVNTFHDDIEDKSQFLTKLEMDFLRKFEYRVKIPEHHSEMVFQIRKMVTNIEEMYKDIKDYFEEMKVGFIYEFIRKIQTLMVVGYNHLSQALLVTFDMYEAQKIKEKQSQSSSNQQPCSCANKNKYSLSKEEFKRLQHIDYTISSIQSEEERLSSQMSTIFERMMMQKNMIDKIKPSLASKQLEEMKDHIETVMENNQKLFEETYMMKLFQFHKHIKTLDKPETITEVYNTMNSSLKTNFIKQTVRTAALLERNRRHQTDSYVNVQTQTIQNTLKIKTRRDPMKDTLTNSPILKSTQSSHFSLGKEKRMNQKLSVEVSTLNRTITALREQLGVYKHAEHQVEQNYKDKCQKVDTIEALYKKTKTQLDNLTRETQFTIATLKKQLVYWKQEVSKQAETLSRKHESMPSQGVQTQRQIRTGPATHIPTGLQQKNSGDAWDMKEEQTQTYDEYLIPDKQNQIVKLLKGRNQKAIIMLNEKDKKIRESHHRIDNLEKQSSMLKLSLDGIIKNLSGHLGNNDGVLDQTQTSQGQSIEEGSKNTKGRNPNTIDKFYQYEAKIQSLFRKIQTNTSQSPHNSTDQISHQNSRQYEVTTANQGGKFTRVDQGCENENDNENEDEVNELPITRLNKKYSVGQGNSLKGSSSKLKRKVSMFNMIMDSKKAASAPNHVLSLDVGTQAQSCRSAVYEVQTEAVYPESIQYKACAEDKVQTERSISKNRDSKLNRFMMENQKTNSRRSKDMSSLKNNRKSQNFLQSRTKLVCTPKSRFMKRNNQEFQKLPFNTDSFKQNCNNHKGNSLFATFAKSKRDSDLEALKQHPIQELNKTTIFNPSVTSTLSKTNRVSIKNYSKMMGSSSRQHIRMSSQIPTEGYNTYLQGGFGQTGKSLFGKEDPLKSKVLLSINRYKETKSDHILQKYLFRLSQRYGLKQVWSIIDKLQTNGSQKPKFVDNSKIHMSKQPNHSKSNTMPALNEQLQSSAVMESPSQDEVETLRSKNIISQNPSSNRLSSKKRIYCQQKNQAINHQNQTSENC